MTKEFLSMKVEETTELEKRLNCLALVFSKIEKSLLKRINIEDVVFLFRRIAKVDNMTNE